jgi:hypothetical protein
LRLLGVNLDKDTKPPLGGKGVHQIDPTTKRIIATFPSIPSAAKAMLQAKGDHFTQKDIMRVQRNIAQLIRKGKGKSLGFQWSCVS